MKILIAAAALLVPFAAAAQQRTATQADPRTAAQAVVQAEILRWRFPYRDTTNNQLYPDVMGTTAIVRGDDLCSTNYTVNFTAFSRDGVDHAAVTRNVPMMWRASARPVRVDGTHVLLTWHLRDSGKLGPGGGQTFDWDLDLETPERARTFADAANILARACATRPLAEG